MSAIMDRCHPVTPCENCPYRMDAPRTLWHRSEFEGVLESQRSQFGKIFNCHKHAALEPHARGFCAGWLLDQKKRGLPSIALRLELCRSAAAREALDAVDARGLRMFRSVQAMCRANGVR
jgi:hypothetical protein